MTSGDEFRFYVHGGTNYELYKGGVKENPYKIDMPKEDAVDLWRHFYSDGRFALPEGWGGEIKPPKIEI